jgi:glycosyltransferase involved in cell wall biosynthesis
VPVKPMSIPNEQRARRFVAGERLEYSPLGRTLRVVSVAHSAFQDGSARLRYYPLASDARLSFTLVIPDRWQEDGRTLLKGSVTGPLNVRTERILLPKLPKAKWYGHFYPRLSKLLKALSPDVIHLWEEPWSVVALQACLLRDRVAPQAALILEADQNILRRLPAPFESIRRYTLNRTDMIIARQQEALDVTRQCGFKGPATFVEYVIDERVFKPQDKTLCRAELGFSGFTIGYVGRILREKGLFTVLKALHKCLAPVRFVCIGAGPDREELMTESQKLGLAGRVHILPFQQPEKVARIMGAMDTLVLMSETTPTWKEQFGRVIIEAQACGTPVIGSDSGSIPHVVGEGGWIVRERNADQLAELLDRLATAPREMSRRQEYARANLNRFSSEVVADHLRSAYFGAWMQRHRTAAGGAAYRRGSTGSPC